MRAVGYAEKYPEFASKLCPACLESSRGHVTMKIWFVRCVEQDEAFISHQCPRCQYVDPNVSPIELDLISRPCGQIFAAAG